MVSHAVQVQYNYCESVTINGFQCNQTITITKYEYFQQDLRESVSMQLESAQKVFFQKIYLNMWSAKFPPSCWHVNVFNNKSVE